MRSRGCSRKAPKVKVILGYLGTSDKNEGHTAWNYSDWHHFVRGGRCYRRIDGLRNAQNCSRGGSYCRHLRLSNFGHSLTKLRGRAWGDRGILKDTEAFSGYGRYARETEGHCYSRISNPTTAVLERRVAALECGIGALCVSSGQAALIYAILNLAAMGSNFVSVPQLCGTTYTLFALILPSQGISAFGFAETDRPAAIEKLVNDRTRAIFCESVGNPVGNICDIEARYRISVHR
jgi:hypothetical protein